MADKPIQVTDTNEVYEDEEATVEVTVKDQQVVTNVNENGYESECSTNSRSDEDIARSVLEIEADAFTRFIERQRTEVMFELRHLRLGERPVTGQSNRGRIETFLNNIQEQQHPNLRVPSSRPTMPSAHWADIDALASRRCVSAALGSVSFRQDLENAIRQSIVSRTPSQVQQIPRAPPVPQNLASNMTESQHSQTIPDLPAVPAVLERPITRQQQAAPVNPTLRNEPFNIQRQERELHAWQAITQLQREMIVLEISDLVHRQLVTSALESDFRQHLEQNIYTRFQQGAPAQQNQSEPIIPTPRIPPTPTPVRTTSNNTASTSNIDELSSRLDGMQRMLQLMFSMQMEMQRSLRQEVASSMANNASARTTLADQPINAGHCTVCLSAIADTVLYRCGHLCVCYMCGLNLRETRSANGIKCPICRAPVEDILRIYKSSRNGE